MVPEVLSGDDVRFLAQQPDAEVSLMLGQMTTLMQNITDLQQDTDDKVAKLESQGWFKRMTNTLFGKNKATKQEIQKNNDQVVTYISQSVAQLYQMNMINERVICSLGNRMNEVYMQVTNMYQEQLGMKVQMSQIMALQQQTLEAMGAFVSKLNEKIESVDNFHMLISEIQNGMYNDSSRLYNLCSILAQLDKRQMDDSRKMNLLHDTMKHANLIPNEEFTVLHCLQEIVALPTDKIGLIYMELCTFRQSFPANLFADMIERYHFLSKMERMSKKKEVLIQRVMDAYELDADAAFSIADITESFFENKQACLVGLASVSQIPHQETQRLEVQESIQPQVQYKHQQNSQSSITTQQPQEDEQFKMSHFKTLYNTDPAAAYKYAHEFATKQVAGAQFAVGQCLYEGHGVNQDKGSAKFYFQRSSEQGFKLATEFLNTTTNWKNDNTSAVSISNTRSNNTSSQSSNSLIRAANSGDHDAVISLALAYYWGEQDDRFGIRGIEENDDAARIWLEKAANLGDGYCQYLFGDCCYNGLGGRQNYQQAAKWLKKAANQGYGMANFRLFEIYINGLGCSENVDLALEYYHTACDILNDGDDICIYCGSTDYSEKTGGKGALAAAVGLGIAASTVVAGPLGLLASGALGAYGGSKLKKICTCNNCGESWDKIN